MFNVLVFSGLYVCLGGLVKISSAWGQKKLLGCGLLGGSVPKTIKPGQLIELQQEKMFSSKIKLENVAGRLVPDYYLSFK